MPRQSQNAGILQALKEGARITPIDALNRFGCFRLGARIADLKKAWHKIKTRMVSKGDKRFAEYSLERT